MSKNAAENREPESHEVVLLGKKYKLRSQHDDEYLAKLAHFVTGQVAEVQRRGAVSTLDAALLAALNIADEYFRHRLDAESRLAEVGEKTQLLLSALDELEPVMPGAPEPVPDPERPDISVGGALERPDISVGGALERPDISVGGALDDDGEALVADDLASRKADASG